MAGAICSLPVEAAQPAHPKHCHLLQIRQDPDLFRQWTGSELEPIVAYQFRVSTSQACQAHASLGYLNSC